MDTPNVTIELADLWRTRPGLTASKTEKAAWYRKKAKVMGHAGHTADAKAAMDHAARLEYEAELEHANGDDGWAVAA